MAYPVCRDLQQVFKKAMPQLTRAATTNGLWLRFLRCPYHANVMKILLQQSKKIVINKRFILTHNNRFLMIFPFFPVVFILFYTDPVEAT